MVGGACVKNVSRVERPTTVAKERPESVILDLFFSSLLLAFFRAHVTDSSSFSWLAGHMRLTKSGKARTKLYA